MTLKDDLRHEKNMSATWEKLAHANKERAEKMEQRAEAAEVAAAESAAFARGLQNELKHAEAARDEARRQLSEAQHAIDAMAQIVGAADEVGHQLEKARSDIEDYRAEIARLTRKAMTTPPHIQEALNEGDGAYRP